MRPVRRTACAFSIQVKFPAFAAEVPFSVGDEVKPFGCALTIKLGTAWEAGQSRKLSVTYSTTTESTALQWLTKEQTQDKQQPFLFTQCQVRRVILCQIPHPHRLSLTGNSRSFPLPLPRHACRQVYLYCISEDCRCKFNVQTARL